jgi:predicted phage terminase large subunit-like protein
MDEPKTQEELIAEAMKDPKQALHQLERIRCQGSLLEFIKAAWHCLHPGEPFVSGWAIETLCAHLEAVSRGEIDRLLINVPPGFAKSMTVNVFWPAWEWGPLGRDHYKYISASYEKGLATRDLMYCRDLIKSEWYQSHWPIVFKADHDGKQEYSNSGRGWRFAASVGSGLTGRRGHRFIIDDPHSVGLAESEAERATARFWFTETTPTRFVDQKRPVYVIIMQRLHEQDISGLIINKLAAEQGWTHLCIPMDGDPIHKSWTCVPSTFGPPARMRRVKEDGEPLPYYVPDEEGELLYPQDPRTEEGELAWPERFDAQSVKDLKTMFRSEGGSYAEDAQLNQRPVPRGGGMFKKGDWKFLDTVPEGVTGWVRGYDLAATDSNKAAWTVGVKLGRMKDGSIVISDVDRYRAGPAEVEKNILSAAQRDGHSVSISIPQDPGQAGKAQIRALAILLHGYNIRFTPESGSKENRAIPIAAQVEVGNVYLVRGEWNDAFIAEAMLFPNGTYMDQIDALSRAYHQLIINAGPRLATTPGRLIRYR